MNLQTQKWPVNLQTQKWVILQTQKWPWFRPCMFKIISQKLSFNIGILIYLWLSSDLKWTYNPNMTSSKALQNLVILNISVKFHTCNFCPFKMSLTKLWIPTGTLFQLKIPKLLQFYCTQVFSTIHELPSIYR